MPKTRSDAVLANLPEERQEQIAEWCDTPKSETCPGGLQFAREQLAADGLQISLKSISRWYEQYSLRQMYESAAEKADDQKRMMLEFDPENVERAEAFGDFTFLQATLGSRDLKGYTRIRQLRETAKKGTRDDRRIRLLEQRMAEAKEKLSAALTADRGGITPETLRRIEEAAALL